MGEIPDPIITVTPSEIIGSNDVGKDDVTIEPTPVKYDYQQGVKALQVRAKPQCETKKEEMYGTFVCQDQRPG